MTTEAKPPFPHDKIFDLFVIGGGVNGCGIARDAAGRGYSVCLAEMKDLASGTSSRSTKLFHGGLRYLEYLEIRLVREALQERETLLKAMPHISWPMRFVLPLSPEMRFESDTPVSRTLNMLMPWAKGKRPKWIIRTGLFLYDTLGGRQVLPGTKALTLEGTPEGKPLKSHLKHAYEYSDCWVDDARLVVLNARDAAARGAQILTRHTVERAEVIDGIWHLTVRTPAGKTLHVKSRMVVNAAGPWAEKTLKSDVGIEPKAHVRLVRGSHIVTPRLYDHDKAYFFQGADGRIIFAIPYEQHYTLIGTTDTPHENPDIPPQISDEERTYLIAFANQYFEKQITESDIVWTYSGVRPLYDDGASSATAATRDYVLKVNNGAGAPVLSVFGGKITTYRRLAESALENIDKALGRTTESWTEGKALPGGDFALEDRGALIRRLADQLPFFPHDTIERLIANYGTEAFEIFADIQGENDLGPVFSNGVSARELAWSRENEWTMTADDFLWRRTKLGLRTTPEDAEAIEAELAR